jgi:endogenous inhibitor of DNA gyrase (YacG/DUF329 family)
MFREFHWRNGDDRTLSERLAMSLVMINCPTTGRAVSTAVEMEPSVFNRLPDIAGRMHCPACGQEHIWAIRSAWLTDALSVADDAVTLPPGSEAA